MAVGPAQVDEWAQSLTGEKHLAASTIRNYQTELRLFSEYICDGRYGWALACEREFGAGVHPVPVCHECNTIAHRNDYEGDPEARPFTRQELQDFLAGLPAHQHRSGMRDGCNRSGGRFVGWW